MDSPLRDMNKENCKKCEGSGIISVPPKDWRDGDYEVAYCHHLSLQKESEWEKEFEKVKGTFEVYGELGIGIDYKKLKEAFSKSIKTAVSSRENEIAEEVEKKSFRGFTPYEQQYLLKKEDVLQILNTNPQ